MDTSNATGPADELAHSEADDLDLIAELVIWNQLPTLSARRLTQLNFIRCAIWCPHNIKRISEARREDDTRDWYFPVFFRDTQLTGLRTETDTPRTPQSSWSWSGMHHLSGAEIHPHPRPLPPLANLPPEWINSRHFDVVASSGGLLLIRLHPCISCAPSSLSQSNWEPLIVGNPLTKEWRDLPAADCNPLNISSWDYRRVLALLVLDDAANSYKVILASRNFVCVYKSTSNSWACRPFPRSGPWGYREQNPNWGYVCASAYAGGRLYFADMEVDAVANAPIVRVFQIDEEAATWQPHNRYTLRREDFFQSPSIFRNSCSRLKIDRCLEMVECRGELYAVIPTMSPATSIETIDDCGAGFDVLPLQFHVYQLKGAGHAHGMMRILVPHTAGDSQLRRDSILAKSSRDGDWFFRNWFKCTARGSAIWVSCEDYLLQYDVVTRQSKTQIVPETSQFDFAGQFSYRPSFHMKP